MVLFPRKIYLTIYGFVLASVVIGFIIMTVLFAKANYIAVTTKPFQCRVIQKVHSDVPCRQGPDPGVCDLLTYRVEFLWRDNVTLTAHIDITQGHTVSTRDPHYLVGETHQCLVQVKSGSAVAAYWSLPEHLEAYRNASLVMGVVVFLVILVSVGAIVFINMRDRMGDEARSLLADTKSPAISVAAQQMTSFQLTLEIGMGNALCVKPSVESRRKRHADAIARSPVNANMPTRRARRRSSLYYPDSNQTPREA